MKTKDALPQNPPFFSGAVSGSLFFTHQTASNEDWYAYIPKYKLALWSLFQKMDNKVCI
jgi:hypothetical protein